MGTATQTMFQPDRTSASSRPAAAAAAFPQFKPTSDWGHDIYHSFSGLCSESHPCVALSLYNVMYHLIFPSPFPILTPPFSSSIIIIPSLSYLKGEKDGGEGGGGGGSSGGSGNHHLLISVSLYRHNTSLPGFKFGFNTLKNFHLNPYILPPDLPTPFHGYKSSWR